MISLENFRLVVFRKVAEKLSFRKAAEDLYLTQPAVSQQIKALEEELNVVLFDRSGTQVKLTPAGEVLLKFSNESSELLHQAAQTVAQFSGTQSGSLNLGASTTVAQYVLPSLLSEFCVANPRVHPTLISGNTEQIVSASRGPCSSLIVANLRPRLTRPERSWSAGLSPAASAAPQSA